MNLLPIPLFGWRAGGRRHGRITAWAAGILLSLSCVLGTAQDEIRLANGMPVEGTLKEVSPAGIVMETPKGAQPYPWKYLSRGTRNRYQDGLATNAPAAAAAAAPAKPVAK